MSFGNKFIGHHNVLKQLEQAFYNKKLSHAHLFVGKDGIGKSIIASKLGKIILNCPENLNHVDLIEWEVGKNKKSIGVGEVRNIIEEVNKKPYEGENKVIIIHNSDKMTIEAQNAFLKTIEEPPTGVYIFLLCENLSDILDTIKSRCQIHKLKQLIFDEIEKFININYKDLDENQVKILVAFSDGIPGKVERLVFDESFKSMRNTIVDFLKNVKTIDKIKLLEYEEIFRKFSNMEEDFFECIISILRDVIIYKETGDKELLINIDKIKELEEIWCVFSFPQLNYIINIIDETRRNLDRNLNPIVVFNDMLLKIQEA